MEKLGLNEIRKRFRDFYVSKDHYAAKSASLIPKDDKSLLIILCRRRNSAVQKDDHMSEMHKDGRYRQRRNNSETRHFL